MDSNFFCMNRNFLSFLFFLMVYPLDFISYMISSNFGFEIPLGFFGSILSIFIFIFLYFFEKDKNILISYFFLIFFLLCLFFIVWFSRNGNLIDYFYLFKVGGAFSCGLLILSFIKNSSSDSIRNILTIFWLVMIFFVFNFKLGENYLRLSDSFAFVSLFLLSLLNRIRYQILLSFLSLCCLYYLESRSALFLFLLTSIVLIFVKNSFSKFILLLIPIFLISYLYVVNLNNKIIDYNENRFLRLIFSTDTDTSLNERSFLNNLGWKTYLDNKYFGDYGYYKYSLGEGAYAHNYISFFAEFGFFGILILFIYLVFLILFISSFIKNINKDNTDYFALSFIFFGFLGIIISKSFHWMFFFFSFGLVVSYFFRMKNKLTH